jgi:hypothetical protein
MAEPLEEFLKGYWFLFGFAEVPRAQLLGITSIANLCPHKQSVKKWPLPYQPLLRKGHTGLPKE